MTKKFLDEFQILLTASQISEGRSQNYASEILQSYRLISLFVLVVGIFPISFMFVSENEFDFLKHYHNWALFFTMLTFVLLSNASLTTESETYEQYI